MNVSEYPKFYLIPIGTKVIIKECHARPEVVNKSGFVAGWVDVEKFSYPLMVMLDEPVFIPVPGVGIGLPFQGPHFCRADELTVVGGDIPDAFKKSFEDDNKEKGGT